MNLESPSEPTREELIALIKAQAAEIAALKARIAELERRLGLNSSNSGKPPSSDGLKKPPRVTSLREPSDKPSGGQKGHKGETLRQVAEPDRIVDHYPPACTACGAAVTPAMSAGHSARQVFDLPEPTPLVVTEHRAHDCRCTGCGARSRASFPDEVKAPVQYGPRIAAVVIYLLHYQLLPEDRLAELMADLFGIRLVAATIARMSRACAARLQHFVIAVRDLVAGAPVKHMDETGFRIGGQTQWLHVACTAWLTFYRVCARRGSLLADVVGIVVHDHWKPYRKPRRTGHNLLLRLANRKQDVLRFLRDLAVPFTNNQAERDARMMKVKQKISGGFRCIAGATDFATIRSFIATAKKQGWNVIQAIAQEPKVLVNSLRIAGYAQSFRADILGSYVA